MEVPIAERIKYMTHMGRRTVRSRDGETETHFLRIQFSRDEAVTVSQAISTLKAVDLPAFQIIQDFCLSLADQQFDEEKAVERMAKVRTRSKLADQLSDEEYQVAISLLDGYKKGQIEKAIRREEAEANKQKKALAPPPPPKVETSPPLPPTPKIRREYIPEPKKR